MPSRFFEKFNFTKRGSSLRTLLIYPFVILIVVAVISTGFLSLYNSGKAAEYMAWQLMGEITARIEDRVLTFLDKAHLVNEINANTIESGQIDLNNVREQELHFWHQVRSFEYISYSYIGRADGGFFGARRLAEGTLQTIATEALTGGKILYFDTDNRGLPTTISSSLPYYDQKTRPWYKAGMEAGKPAWSPVFVDAGGEGLTITAATPLYDNSKTMIGVLGCSFIFSHINQFLSTLKIGESGLTYIIERSGMLVATSTSDATFTADKKRIASSGSENPKINQTSKSISEQFGDLSNIDQKQRLSIHVQDERYFVQLSPLTDHRGIDWLIVVIVPENDFMSHIKAGNFNTVLLSLLALCVTVVVGFTIARRITRPILELNIAARSLADGEWSHELKIDRRDEVGELARSFNFMVKNLQTTTVSLDRLAEEIEERKRIESELHNLAAVVEHSSELVSLAALDGKMIFLNEAGGIMLGITPRDVENYSIMEVIPDELKPKVEKEVLPTILKESRWEGELQYRNLITGALVDVYAMTFTLRNSDGEPLYLANVSLDITKRKRAEEALEESKRRLSEIIDFAPDATFAIDKDGKVIAWNRAIEEMTGVKATDMLGKGNYEYSLPFYGVRRPILIDLVFISDEEIKNKYHFVRKEGEIIIAEADVPVRGINQALWGKACPLYDNKGNIVGAIESIRDITERKKMEDMLASEHERLISILDGIPIPIFMVDSNRQVVLWNRYNEAYSGMPKDSILGKPLDLSFLFREKVSPSLAELILELGDDDLTAAFGARGLRKSEVIPNAFESVGRIWVKGEERILSIQAARVLDSKGLVVGAVQTAQDITESKNLEAQLLQIQKMEAIGTLAGGIAHDFNNILSAIIGYTEMTKAKIDQPALQGYLEQVLRACDRARSLVGQILTFSRVTEYERKPIELASVIKEGLKLLRATIPATIEIRDKITPGTHAVLADPTQIHQILINLCTNAAYAMRERGGVIDVSLDNLAITRNETTLDPDLSPGPYVKLTVSDTGTGITPEVMHRIFDPFFTTKQTGEGTGLGLSLVYGIVKGGGGTVSVHSERGKGSIFSVYLPAIMQNVEAQEETPEPVPEGKERVLFIDDEDILVEMGSHILGDLGYQVTATTSSTKALELFKNQPDQFDVVVTDMTMPGMTGVDLAKEILRLRPEIPIILCTGFSELITEEKAMALGIRGFAMKPLRLRNIAELLRKILTKNEIPLL